MKRFSILLGLVLALMLVSVGSAYANFGPHGGYITDTDSCAGCHRAHTSFSSVTFDPKVASPDPTDPKPYALLVGSAGTMTEFCYACHGDAAPGASTNVEKGVFDSGPSGDITRASGAAHADGTVVAYETKSTFGGALNGGGFASMPDPDAAGYAADPSSALKTISSAHTMEATNILWGAGSSAPGSMNLTCTGCHDPHGSTNYRLLNDSVNGVTVGGYAADGVTPQGTVFSVEDGYDAVYADGGWLKHEAGQAQMAAYKPDYTGGTKIRSNFAQSGQGSLSTWCSACHSGYNVASSDANYGSNEAFGASSVGTKTRHRHPVDIPLTAGDAILNINAQDDGNPMDSRIPLEVTVGAGSARQNNLGCLTCHFAHGSNSDMSGWSNAHLETNAAGTWVPVRDTVAGVNPDKADNAAGGVTGTSALLRADNRGVCERCHDK